MSNVPTNTAPTTSTPTTPKSTKMLEYFTYKRFKKHQADKLAAAKAEEVLSPQDEEYLERIVSEDEEASDAPRNIPLQNRIEGESSSTAATNLPPSSSSSTKSSLLANKKHVWKTDLVDRAKSVKMPQLPQLPSIGAMPAFMQSKKDGKKKNEEHEGGEVAEVHDDAELTKEEKELHEALDQLNLAAQDGKAFSLSKETKTLLNSFTQILKDLVNGVPTAYDDLIKLFETSASQIESLFESTPGFVKKLIKTIPLGGETKAGSTAEGAELASKAALLGIPTLKELIKRPGSIAATLRTVLNALKLRFPGLAMGSNVLYSMGLFVLLFIFWYCYKRGREVRLEKEAAEAEASAAAIAEAPDAPTTEPGTTTTAAAPPLAIERSAAPVPVGIIETKGAPAEPVPVLNSTAL